MTSFAYPLVFLASFLVDCIPVFAPPAWTLMLLLMIKFDLNAWIVVSVGTCGTVSGRLVFSSFIVPWLGDRTLGKARKADLRYLGDKLSGRGWAVFIFVFIYSILPLSTTALFTASGLAKVKKRFMIPPFFLGNFLGDALLLTSGKRAIHGLEDLYKGSLDLKNIALMLAGLLVVLLFVLIDWQELLEKQRLHLRWNFWR